MGAQGWNGYRSLRTCSGKISNTLISPLCAKTAQRQATHGFIISGLPYHLVRGLVTTRQKYLYGRNAAQPPPPAAIKGIYHRLPRIQYAVVVAVLLISSTCLLLCRYSYLASSRPQYPGPVRCLGGISVDWHLHDNWQNRWDCTSLRLHKKS